MRALTVLVFNFTLSIRLISARYWQALAQLLLIQTLTSALELVHDWPHSFLHAVLGFRMP